MTISENYSLKSLNTFGVESKAKYFIELSNEPELKENIKSVNRPAEKIYILGGGSNVLFVKDFDGIILKYSQKGIEVVEESDEYVIISVNAGEVWDDVVQYCVEKNYYGIENLSAIPGLTGAAPIQNIGAYGVEVKDVIESVEGYFIDSAEKVVLNKSECGFGYRTSVFKEKYFNKIVVTSVKIRLDKKKKLNLTYRALKDYFAGKSENEISIENVSEAIRKIRSEKLPDTSILGNAGSFFKNPEIPEEHLRKLELKYRDIVYHKIAHDIYKIPAGWLIEKSGFRGKKIGNVGCYKKQALVIVNFGNATGNEILEFAEEIRSEVKRNFQIELENEVNIL